MSGYIVVCILVIYIKCKQIRYYGIVLMDKNLRCDFIWFIYIELLSDQQLSIKKFGVVLGMEF